MAGYGKDKHICHTVTRDVVLTHHKIIGCDFKKWIAANVFLLFRKLSCVLCKIVHSIAIVTAYVHMFGAALKAWGNMVMSIDTLMVEESYYDSLLEWLKHALAGDYFPFTEQSSLVFSFPNTLHCYLIAVADGFQGHTCSPPPPFPPGPQETHIRKYFIKLDLLSLVSCTYSSVASEVADLVLRPLRSSWDTIANIES